MEIIKNNFRRVPKSVPSRKIRCKHCKSKLRVTYEDLKMYYNNIIPMGYYFECQCCNGKLELSLKKGRKLKKPNGSMLDKLGFAHLRKHWD